MNKEVTKVNFDLSTLSLSELIKVYEDINGFLQLLNDKKIVEEEKAGDKNE
jgi:hypothetical protein